jgi:hypothetical protein
MAILSMLCISSTAPVVSSPSLLTTPRPGFWQASSFDMPDSKASDERAAKRGRTSVSSSASSAVTALTHPSLPSITTTEAPQPGLLLEAPPLPPTEHRRKRRRLAYIDVEDANRRQPVDQGGEANAAHSLDTAPSITTAGDLAKDTCLCGKEPRIPRPRNGMSLSSPCLSVVSLGNLAHVQHVPCTSL